jgi:hypothetical protein
MPKNTAAGFVLAMISGDGFALIWHMRIIAGASFALLIVAADRAHQLPARLPHPRR